MNYIADLSELLTSLEEKYDRNNSGLKSLISDRLFHTTTAGKKQFYKVKTGLNTDHRKAINSNPLIIKQLIWKLIKEKENAILKKDIDLLKRLIDEFIEPNFENVFDSLSDHDKRLGLRLLSDALRTGETIMDASIENKPFSNQTFPSADFIITAETRARIDSHIGWAKLNHATSTAHPESKTQVTAKGQLVRSRAEVIIADQLDHYGIPYVYEKLVSDGTTTLAPDFSFEGWDKRPFYWEYSGMMDNPEYVERHKQKLQLYESMGIVPWDNLIITYGTGNEINARMIDNTIRDQIIPRL